MELKDVKKNNYLNDPISKKIKNTRRRSSIKRKNIGKSIRNLSNSNSINQEEFLTKLPTLQKVPILKSNMKSVYPLSKRFVISIIILNFILPGVGTMISCLKIEDIQLKKSFYALGFCSLITSPLIIGYILSLISSYFFYKCYLSNSSIERFLYSINKIQQK